jgi:hypothetical protein
MTVGDGSGVGVEVEMLSGVGGCVDVVLGVAEER